MPAQDFQITPMLLLGEPGIGKTHLATQLASVLALLHKSPRSSW